MSQAKSLVRASSLACFLGRTNERAVWLFVLVGTGGEAHRPVASSFGATMQIGILPTPDIHNFDHVIGFETGLAELSVSHHRSRGNHDPLAGPDLFMGT